jgi:alpha-glucan, water dikinase
VQALARAIGENCGVERWTIDLFAEEVVRGGPAFAVSLVLATVEPALRRCADLGSWQIISPADVIGTYFHSLLPLCVNLIVVPGNLD